MDQSLSFITFATADLDAARTFYRDGLGWEPLLDVPDEIIFFQVAPALVLGLFEQEKFRQDLGSGSGSPGDGAGVSGVTLSHNVSSPADVDATVRHLESIGATVLLPPQPGPFGGVYHGHVVDPNGIGWEIAHNPGWHVTEDGDVLLG